MKTTGLKWAIVSTLLAACAVCGFSADDNEVGNQYKESDGFVAHEWGVTRIFQQGGSGQCDVPDFVTRGEIENPWRECTEKPVVYLYSPKDRTVNVAVGTPQYGQVLYWPPATVGVYQARDVQNARGAEKKQAISDDAIYENSSAGEVFWQDVKVTASRDLKSAREVKPDHWWAQSREARSNVLSCGGEKEKFLFYEVPDCDMGNTLYAQSVEGQIAITATIPYDANGKPLDNKALYKNVFMIQATGKAGKIMFKQELEIPATEEPLLARANVDFSKVESLDLAGDEWANKTRLKLQRELEAAGFYADEARIITEIWSRDFFQKAGNRIVYFLDREVYDRMMPLYISEAPGKTVRLMLICVEY